MRKDLIEELARSEAQGNLIQAKASAWLPYAVIGLLAALSLGGLVAASRFNDDQSKASAMQTLRDIGVGLLGALSLGGGAVAASSGAKFGREDAASPPSEPPITEPIVFPVPERAALWDEPPRAESAEVAPPKAQPLSPVALPESPPGSSDKATASDGDRFDTEWSYDSET